MTPARIQPADIPASTRVRITGGPLTGTEAVVVTRLRLLFGDVPVFRVRFEAGRFPATSDLRRDYLEVVS